MSYFTVIHNKLVLMVSIRRCLMTDRFQDTNRLFYSCLLSGLAFE